MQKMSKLLVALGILAVVILIGLGVGWLATRGSPPAPRPTTDSGPRTEIPSPPRLPITKGPSGLTPEPVVVPENSNPIEHSTPVLASTTITNWEDKLNDILGSESDDTNKVTELFQMFPHLPEDGQVEVAQHLSNLVDDEDYAGLGKLAENAKLPEAVLDVLMADLLNRPNAAKLPVFLDIAKTSDHAKAEEARDLLELYLDEDYGNDWSKWEHAMKEWLKENPD